MLPHPSFVVTATSSLAKNSSADLVLVAVHREGLSREQRGKAQVSAATSSASVGSHLVDSTKILVPSG